MQLLKRAERLPNGRIKGVAPPQLWPKVMRRLTANEMAQILAMQERVVEMQRKQRALMVSLGLDPRRRYRLTEQGEVIEIGSHIPKY